jgi:hypothetical protein
MPAKQPAFAALLGRYEKLIGGKPVKLAAYHFVAGRVTV